MTFVCRKKRHGLLPRNSLQYPVFKAGKLAEAAVIEDPHKLALGRTSAQPRLQPIFDHDLELARGNVGLRFRRWNMRPGIVRCSASAGGFKRVLTTVKSGKQKLNSPQ